MVYYFFLSSYRLLADDCCTFLYTDFLVVSTLLTHAMIGHFYAPEPANARPIVMLFLRT